MAEQSSPQSSLPVVVRRLDLRAFANHPSYIRGAFLRGEFDVEGDVQRPPMAPLMEVSGGDGNDSGVVDHARSTSPILTSVEAERASTLPFDMSSCRTLDAGEHDGIGEYESKRNTQNIHITTARREAFNGSLLGQKSECTK